MTPWFVRRSRSLLACLLGSALFMVKVGCQSGAEEFGSVQEGSERCQASAQPLEGHQSIFQALRDILDTKSSHQLVHHGKLPPITFIQYDSSNFDIRRNSGKGDLQDIKCLGDKALEEFNVFEVSSSNSSRSRWSHPAVINVFHMPEMSSNSSTSSKFMLDQGLYRLVALQFHYFQPPQILNGEMVHLEIKLIHTPALRPPSDRPEQVAVLVLFVSLDDSTESISVQADISNKMEQKPTPTSSKSADRNLRLDIFQPENTQEYYRTYSDSGRTSWTVFSQTIKVFKEDLSPFKSIESANNTDNGTTIFHIDNEVTESKLALKVASEVFGGPKGQLQGWPVYTSTENLKKAELRPFSNPGGHFDNTSGVGTIRDLESKVDNEANEITMSDHEPPGLYSAKDGKGALANASKSGDGTVIDSSEDELDEDGERLPKEVDHFFLLIMAIIIFFMQCGFAFMEAGAVRSKNTVNILIKNWLDMCIGALVYWSVGFGLTFGNSPPTLSPFVGTSYFFFYKMPAHKLSKWFFQFVFAATAATLVSGSLAERCNFIAYIVYSIMITGFIYPIIAHWAWHPQGWLRVNGFHDFAGSAVVHLTGAVCALVGCVLMGPRHGRFNKTTGQPVAMPGHSVPLSALGGLILVFGFFACNGTKQGSISQPGDGLTVATSIVNTALGTSAAGLSTLIFSKTGIVPGTGKNYSFLITMNGSLTGTIALCAGCNVFPSWASVIIGGLSGPLFVFTNFLLVKCRIDDPLDAIPVHGAGGVLGTLAVYIFKAEDGLISTGFSNKSALLGLAWNLVGLLAITAWTGVTCFVMFSILAKLKMLRINTEQEFKGMDLLKHGESAYPADAWVEQQYMKEDAFDNGALIRVEVDPNSTEMVPINYRGSSDVMMKGSHHKGFSSSKAGLPPHMSFSRAASYNNPHEMFPSTSKLFSGFSSVAGNTTGLLSIHNTKLSASSSSIGNLAPNFKDGGNSHKQIFYADENGGGGGGGVESGPTKSTTVTTHLSDVAEDDYDHIATIEDDSSGGLSESSRGQTRIHQEKNSINNRQNTTQQQPQVQHQQPQLLSTRSCYSTRSYHNQTNTSLIALAVAVANTPSRGRRIMEDSKGDRF